MSTKSVDSSLNSRKRIEWAAGTLATMSLAGAWGGVRYQPGWFLTGLAGLSVCLVLGCIAYAMVARRGRVLLQIPMFGLAVIGQEMLLGLCILIGVVTAPLALLLALIRWSREDFVVVGQGLLFAAAAMGGIVLHHKLQIAGAHRAATRGEAIIEAIERYRLVENRYPSALQDLVPRELGDIPDTGMVGFRSFEYIAPATDADGDPEKRPFSTYELRVDLSKLLKFDCLVYWPERNYPDVLYGGGVERVRDWAYVHE
jgi:hypothetical protein